MDKNKTALLETSNYIYTNPITRWITLKGHQACARLRRYDMPGVTVVDLGCGEGDHFPFVKQADILGVDILPEMLERAERKYSGRAQLMQADIFSISEFLPPGLAKSIVSVGTLEHLAPLEKALGEIEKILADDGEFIWGIPTEGLLYRIGRELTTKRHVQKETGVDYDALLAQEHVNRCRDIVRALKRYFHIDTMRGVPFGIPSVDLNFMLVGRCVKKTAKTTKKRNFATLR